MKNVQFTFTIDKKTSAVISINGNELKEPQNFVDFFDEFLSRNIFCFEDESYSPSTFFSFFQTGKLGEYLEFKNVDKIAYQFKIISISTDDLTVGLIRRDDGRNDIDFLTGVNSRSSLFSKIESELKKGDNDHAYIFMMDLDNFKQINDTYGHIVGDMCLQTIAEKLQAVFKDEVFGRYGGDEFLAFIKNCDEEKLSFLMKQVLQVRFQYEKNSDRKAVTCSVGSCQPIKDRKDIYSLIQEADNALYQSKSSGKNKGYIYLSEGFENKSHTNFLKKQIELLNERSSLLFKEEIHKKRIKYFAILSSLLIFFLTLIISIDTLFLMRNEELTRHLAQTIAEEQTNTISGQVSNRVENSFNNLENCEMMMSLLPYDNDNHQFIQDCLKTASEKAMVNNPGILLSNGDVYFGKEGDYFNISTFKLCQNLVLEKKSSVQIVNFLGDGDKIVFGVPCENMDYYNEEDGNLSIKGVVSIYEPEDFAQFIFGNFINSKGYLALLSRNGNKICDDKNSSFDFFDGYHNFGNRFTGDNESFKQAFLSGLEAQSSMEYMGLDLDGSGLRVGYYFFFDNSGILSRGDFSLDWTILIVLPFDLVASYFNGIKVFSIVVVNVLSIVFGLAFLIFVIYSSHIKIRSFILTNTDSLTHSINERRFFSDSLTLLSRSESCSYLVFLSVQKFQFINNKIGTLQSENLLLEISNSLSQNLEKNELLSRQYFDRFLLFLQAEDDVKLKNRLIRILDSITLNCDLIQDEKPHFNAGVYRFTKKNEPSYLAVDRAKKVWEAIPKDETKNSIKFFDSRMMERNELEVYIEQTMESALTLGKFHVFYQGKYDLRVNRFTSCEALVRWIDDTKGTINTQFFIDIFEKNGFILKLDFYVFEHVLIDIKNRLEEGKEVIPVSINVSRRHFDNPNFFDSYEELIKKYDIPTKYIEFEITESIVLNNANNLSSTLERMHAIGCKVSIDDFGSGFSNLSMLNRTEYDILKMDRNLLFGKNGFDDYSRNILKMVVGLNKSLGKEVVCEGVENKEESDFLLKIGCDWIQGYYYCKPLPLDSFNLLLDDSSENK